MNKVIAILILSITVATSAPAADAPDERTPLDRYRGNSAFYLMSCSLRFKIATAKAELGQPQDDDSNYRACITEGKDNAKNNLAEALRTVSKAKAQEALKSYHVAFVTALQGIVPGADERQISYEQRQQNLEDKVTEAWVRFEVEQ